MVCYTEVMIISLKTVIVTLHDLRRLLWVCYTEVMIISLMTVIVTLHDLHRLLWYVTQR